MTIIDTGVDRRPIDENECVEQAQTFESWFGAVEGYLGDTSYGRHADTIDLTLDEARRDQLITALCNYCVGETAALESASGLVRLAPGPSAKVFMATQVVDEARHLEVFLHRLTELGVTDPEAEIACRANPALFDFAQALLDLVEAGDWNAALFAQTVVLETTELTVLQTHAETADPVTADILAGVIADERRHFGFAENSLGRQLTDHPVLRPHLQRIRTQLEPIALDVFDNALCEIEAPAEARGRLGRHYLTTIERLGLT